MWVTLVLEEMMYSTQVIAVTDGLISAIWVLVNHVKDPDRLSVNPAWGKRLILDYDKITWYEFITKEVVAYEKTPQAEGKQENYNAR